MTYLSKSTQAPCCRDGKRLRYPASCDLCVEADRCLAIDPTELVVALRDALGEHDDTEGRFSPDYMPNHWTHAARAALAKVDAFVAATKGKR